MRKSHPIKKAQLGGALIIVVVILLLVASGALFSLLDGRSVKIERDKKTAAVLAEAKLALIGFAIGKTSVNEAGYLPNPDFHLSPLLPEGSQEGVAAATDITVLGKFPWYSLNTPPFKDGWNECLWYVVSGRNKAYPQTAVLNWDTLGQIDVIDAGGNTLASNLAALIVSPGRALAGQDRSLVAADTPQCGGSYDAINYLDAYDATHAIAGAVNYFATSTNHRQAPNTNSKVFVLAQNSDYNDRFVFVTIDDIFRPLMRRSDFSEQITSLLVDPYLQTVAISGSKGTGSINCALTSAANLKFCNNWKEMLLMVKLAVPAPIMIDGITKENCSRVLMFAGQKIAGQMRLTAVDKSGAANYIEGTNLSAFNLGTNNFVGFSKFAAANPSADVLRCVPKI
jgi:type II secretory pathway pseudopilin PulG